MARLKRLSERYRGQVARLLGSFIAPSSTLLELRKVNDLELRENFPLAVLPSNEILATNRDLSMMLISTGFEMFLVYRAGQGVGFAVAHSESVARPIIDAYSESVEIQTLAEQIVAIDAAGIADHYEARILDDRVRHLGAIVLVSNRTRPSLAVPYRVPPGQDRLKIGMIYDSEVFIQAVKDLGTSIGLRLE